MSCEQNTVLLGELISHKKGFAFKSNDYVDIGVPVVRVSNFTDDSISRDDLKFVSASIAKVNSNVTLRANDIVVATVGSWPNNPASVVGRTISVPTWAEHALMNQNSVIIRSKSDSLMDQRFIYYQMKSREFSNHVISKAQGSANQASITLDAIFSFTLLWPESGVRASVVTILNALDDRITLLRDTNTTLEAIAQALFKSWFVDFDPVHAKMQGRAPDGMSEATAALFPDSFEESELGPVPKGWRLKTMADVSTVGIGKTPPRKEPQWFTEKTSDVRWVSIRDMGNVGIYASQTSEYLTSEAVEKFNVRVVPDNTTLMSFKLTVGRVALTDGEMTTNEAIAHFKLDKKSAVTSEFIYLYLKQFNFSSLSSTSSIAEAVNSKTVREIPILVSSLELMTAFQDNVNPLFNQLKNAEALAANLSVIRDTLLPRLISGQLRSSELGSFIGEKVLSS